MAGAGEGGGKVLVWRSCCKGSPSFRVSRLSVVWGSQESGHGLPGFKAVGLQGRVRLGRLGPGLGCVAAPRPEGFRAFGLYGVTVLWWGCM
eukprot:12338455-Alexandrium_andersonii.AAC.1